MNQKQNSLVSSLFCGAFIGALYGLVGTVIFDLEKDLSNVDQLFLFRIGGLAVSILFYNLVYFICVGIFAGLAARIISRWSGKPLALPDWILTAGLLGMHEVIFRIIAYKRLGVFVILLAGVFFLGSKISKKQQRNAPGRRKGWTDFPAAAFVIAILVGAFLLPVLYQISIEGKRNNQAAARKSPNILMIVMDTARADHFSSYGYPKKTSPNFDAVAKQGALFLNAISAAPWTLSSHASIFTGLYPSQHGADWGNSSLHSNFVTLAEYLQSRGYHTVGFWENPWIGGKYQGLAQGFREFYSLYEYPIRYHSLGLARKAGQLLTGRKDTLEYTEDTLRHFKTWILRNESEEKPFFAFINFIVCHTPNYPRPKFVNINWTEKELSKIEKVNVGAELFYLPEYRLNEKELSIMRDIYDGEIAYLDSKIGELVRFLEEKQVLDNTILIILSDHGENFGDHGYIEHQFCLYDSLLHVPLIIRYPPKIQPGQVVKERVSTTFIFQTVAELLGEGDASLPAQIEKRSLFGNQGDQTVYAEYASAVKMLKGIIEKEAPGFDFKPFDRTLYAAYMERFKLIGSSDGREELYDLKADAKELRNILDQESPRAEEVRRAYDKWQSKAWKPKFNPEDEKMDSATKRALRSLGYVK